MFVEAPTGLFSILSVLPSSLLPVVVLPARSTLLSLSKLAAPRPPAFLLFLSPRGDDYFLADPGDIVAAQPIL